MVWVVLRVGSVEAGPEEVTEEARRMETVVDALRGDLRAVEDDVLGLLSSCNLGPAAGADVE